MKFYQKKDCQAKQQLVDIDNNKGIVKGYFSTFNIVDMDGDVIRKGAFTKSIMERGPDSNGNRRIQHLRQHDFNMQIGMIKELYEDDMGLVFVSKLGRSTLGQDALMDYQDGILREHSIGFLIPDGKFSLIEETGGMDIKEVNLFEGSGVTFGANPETMVMEVTKEGLSSVNKYVELLNERMNAYITALKNGKGTDDRLYNIEMGLKVCQQEYNDIINKVNSLIGKEPEADPSTLEDEPKDNSKSKFLKAIMSYEFK